MNQKENKGGLIIGEQGPVWTIKIGISTNVSGKILNKPEETKHWKLKVILN